MADDPAPDVTVKPPRVDRIQLGTNPDAEPSCRAALFHLFEPSIEPVAHAVEVEILSRFGLDETAVYARVDDVGRRPILPSLDLGLHERVLVRLEDDRVFYDVVLPH